MILTEMYLSGVGREKPVAIQDMSKDLPEGLAFKEDLSLYRYCNGNLNFSTASHEDEDFGYQKKKIMRVSVA